MGLIKLVILIGLSFTLLNYVIHSNIINETNEKLEEANELIKKYSNCYCGDDNKNYPEIVKKFNTTIITNIPSGDLINSLD